MTMDERKQEMREIMAEEADKTGCHDFADSIRHNQARPGGWMADCINRALDRFAALPLESSKGRKERVDVVAKILDSHLWPGSVRKQAERIVATEPRAMSREEMVEVVATFVRGQEKWTDAKMIEEGNRMSYHSAGPLDAIDALAGKIPASNEAEAWQKKHACLLEHTKRVEAACGEKTTKIRDLEQEVTKLKWHTPAEGPDRLDRLDRICELLLRIPRNKDGRYPHVLFWGDRTGSIGYSELEMRGCLRVFAPDDPEQVIAEYVAGLDKSSDLQRELDGLGDDCPAMRKLAEKELKATE